MSTDATRKDTDDVEPDEVPVAQDLPLVDGTEKSSDELRAEMAELAEAEERRRDERATASGETVAELAARTGATAPVKLPPRSGAAPRVPHPAPAATGKDGSAAAVTGAVREQPGVFAAAAAAVALVILLVLRRRKARSS